MTDIPNSFNTKDPGLKLKTALHMAALIFTIIGALNWGLIGLCGFDLVAYLCGPMSKLSQIIYTIVGISGIYWLIALKKLI